MFRAVVSASPGQSNVVNLLDTMPLHVSHEPPVHLPSSILRSSRETAPTAPSRARPARARQTDRQREPTFIPARQTENELILFDTDAAESWIIYPPRSAYAFLAPRRRDARATIVEHHPWSAVIAPIDHIVDPRSGCHDHGVQCQAQVAVATAVSLGYDPFA